MSIKAYLDQDYNRIKKKCASLKSLFVDNLFPASKESIYRVNKIEGIKGEIKWKRPYEICKNPEFIIDGIEPEDFDQGVLGNCWVISAFAAISSIPKYMRIVVPSDQSFKKGEYLGIFRFRFWNFGKWVEVVVDDRLPVNYKNKLIFCHNDEQPNEFIGPLLEKAYAKFHGCYEFLEGGQPIDSLIDLTGGVHETFVFNKYSNKITFHGENDGNLQGEDTSSAIDHEKFWDIVYKSWSFNSLSITSIDVRKDSQKGDSLSNGLIIGHAYTILEVYEIYSTNNDDKYDALRIPGHGYLGDSEKFKFKNSIKILRLRNPWGNKIKWNGEWNKSSKNWEKINKSVKEILLANSEEDGQFLISFDEFIKIFDNIEFVHANLNAYNYNGFNEFSPVKWPCKSIEGSWRKGINSGGSGVDDESDFWQNPQFSIDLTLKNKQNQYVSIIVSLMQQQQFDKNTKKRHNEALAVNVFKIQDKIPQPNNGKYDPDNLVEMGSSCTYLFRREISKRFDLLPGKYVIVPSTFKKDIDLNFFLRIFVESEELSSEELVLMSLNQNKAQIRETVKFEDLSKTNKILYSNFDQFPRNSFKTNLINPVVHYAKISEMNSFDNPVFNPNSDMDLTSLHNNIVKIHHF